MNWDVADRMEILGAMHATFPFAWSIDEQEMFHLAIEEVEKRGIHLVIHHSGAMWYCSVPLPIHESYFDETCIDSMYLDCQSSDSSMIYATFRTILKAWKD